MADFAGNLRKLRQERGLSQEEFARSLGISKSSVSMYECGARRPDFEMLEGMADFFDVDLSSLLGHSASVTKLAGAPADDSVDLSAGVSVTLAADERALIKAYRMASADTKAACRAVLGVKS